MTSLIAIAVNPLVTFLVGHSRAAIESLAVLPVITGFVFVFRSGGIAYQEVAVALVGANRQAERPVARVAGLLAAASALALSLILFTPLAEVWFGRICGLSPALTAFAHLAGSRPGTAAGLRVPPDVPARAVHPGAPHARHHARHAR